MTRSPGQSGAASSKMQVPYDNPDLWLPRLARILDDQIALYRSLSELSSRQSSIIETGETDALLSVLGQRQSLVERITDLNEELEPFTQRWDELSCRLSDDRKAGIRERLDALDVLVGEIARRDERDRLALERQRDAVSTELKGNAQNRGALNAYAAASRQPHVPRYQDRKG
ncbi:MAG: hypothetical protein Tsb0013_12640 [Phycisphaerales bacterium]